MDDGAWTSTSTSMDDSSVGAMTERHEVSPPSSWRGGALQRSALVWEQTGAEAGTGAVLVLQAKAQK